ncbi:MAG: dTDP-4-dehydrorhamnose 3,5-epimerase [Pseudomonadota bacterium]
MQITSLAIPDIKVVTPKIFRDDRGFFSETFNASVWEDAGLTDTFVQDNHVLSRSAGVLRGLHFQLDPSAQGKLVRVARGSVLDVAVDIRHGSPTFGQHVSRVLSAENWEQLWVPIGFAHGYCTLEPDTEVIYKVTNFYNPANERGIKFDDPALGIDWTISREQAQMSAKDLENKPLSEHPTYFEYSEG